MFKKATFLPSQPRRAKTRLSTGKAVGALASGAYTGVDEQDKWPRTQLADFFNLMLKNGVNLFRRASQDSPLSFFCQGTLNQIGVFQHEVDQFILANR